MPLRVLQVVVPEADRLDLEGLLEGHEPVSSWQQARSGDRVTVNLVVEAGEVEPIMDRIDRRFNSVPGFRVLLYPLEAVLPRPATGLDDAPSESDDKPKERAAGRVSREELVHNIQESLGKARIHAVMTALSVVVAAVGLLRDELAIIIAAMVIAPLLGPNMALALATTLADAKLASVALRRAGLGVAIGLGLSVGIGMVLRFTSWGPADLMAVEAIHSRTLVLPSDFGLALAAGVAGSLAFTTGASATLIGVMVAVALVPPLVVFGILLGAGEVAAAGRAGLLLATNLVSINVAGIVTFLVQGVRPREWWQGLRATRVTRLGLVVWLVLLLSLTAWVAFSSYRTATGGG